MIIRIDMHLDTQSERDAQDIASVMTKIGESLSELLLTQVVITSEILDED